MKTKMKTKTKAFRVGLLILAFFALMLLDFLPGLRARAAAPEDTGAIGFYVQAVLPENQVDKTLTYFDLRMAPGGRQTLEVEVVNETGEVITVDIEAISASTNRNGVIDYKTPGIRDATLANPFSELARVETGGLSVPAGGSATARITVEMPAQPYDGVVLGGLVFTRRDARPRQGGGGASLQNLYSYVIGVKLSESDTVVDPDFELVDVQGELVNYQPALVHSIRNKNAAIAKGVDLHVILRDENGQVVGEAARSNIDMAPNSTMPLAVTPAPPAESGNGAPGTGGTELRPGDYTSEVTLTHGGESWTFADRFTIGRTEAEAINTQAVGSAGQNAGGPASGRLLVILLAVAAAVILGLFVIILLMLRRREETKELNRLMRRRREQLRLQNRYGRTDEKGSPV